MLCTVATLTQNYHIVMITIRDLANTPSHNQISLLCKYVSKTHETTIHNNKTAPNAAEYTHTQKKPALQAAHTDTYCTPAYG